MNHDIELSKASALPIPSSWHNELSELGHCLGLLRKRALIFGGAAASLYGLTRRIRDIDVLTSKHAWLSLQRTGFLQPSTCISATRGPLEVWFSPLTVFQEGTHHTLLLTPPTWNRALALGYGAHIRAAPLEQILLMKAIMRRGENVGKHDLSDIEQLLNLNRHNLDMPYLRSMASIAGASHLIEGVLQT